MNGVRADFIPIFRAFGNPKLDLNGFDAFAKVRILSALAFNNQISHHKCIMEGIENIDLKDIKIANQLNLRIKLLGICEMINNRLVYLKSVRLFLFCKFHH